MCIISRWPIAASPARAREVEYNNIDSGIAVRLLGTGQRRGALKSSIVKRSVALAENNTSVSLEDAFWRGLKDIARSRRTTLSNLINSIDLDRDQGNLSSALRLFVLDHYQMRPLASLMAPR